MNERKRQAWTREPWHVASYGNPDGVGLNSHLSLVMGQKVIASTINEVATDEDDANMRRAAACVNACAGIDDPAALRQQRDDLLAACEAVVAEHPSEGGRGIDLPQSMLAQLNAEIAKASGAPGS